MKDYLALIDRRTLGLPGMRCRDITPIFCDPEAFNALTTDLCRDLRTDEIDAVVGLEALGFIIATAIAVRINKPLVPIRKAGKLPVQTARLELPAVRGQARTLELRAGALEVGARVLLVDDWIKSGTQIAGAIQLLEGEGANVAGVVALNLEDTPITRALVGRYAFYTVMRGGRPVANSSRTQTQEAEVKA